MGGRGSRGEAVAVSGLGKRGFACLGERTARTYRRGRRTSRALHVEKGLIDDTSR